MPPLVTVPRVKAPKADVLAEMEQVIEGLTVAVTTTVLSVMMATAIVPESVIEPPIRIFGSVVF